MIDIGSLITYLNTKTSITTKVSNRIFYGLPGSEQTSTYITIMPISNNTTTEVEEKIRLEIRAIGGDTKVNFSTLQAITNAVYEELSLYKNDGVYRCYKANNYSGYDEKNRKVYILDILLGQTR